MSSSLIIQLALAPDPTFSWQAHFPQVTYIRASTLISPPEHAFQIQTHQPIRPVEITACNAMEERYILPANGHARLAALPGWRRGAAGTFHKTIRGFYSSTEEREQSKKKAKKCPLGSAVE